jgi:guanosine-3',5'-bis(diphosphate) 3'-pyrophosphohydrolase
MRDSFDPNYLRLLQAASFASRAHRHQMRKDGQTPYVSHPFRVCLVVRDLFGFADLHMQMVAILHDTIEDTNTDFDDLAEAFGTEVASWAAALSKDKRLPEGRRETAYVRALRKAPWQVQVCKLADVVDNLLDLPQLPRDRQSHSLQRAEGYYEALEQDAAPELRRPLAIAAQVLAQARQIVASSGEM